MRFRASRHLLSSVVIKYGQNDSAEVALLVKTSIHLRIYRYIRGQEELRGIN